MQLMTILAILMVMKKASRYSVAEAKARLSEVLRAAQKRPVVIHNRGRDVGVVVSMDDFAAGHPVKSKTAMVQWLERAAEWRQRSGGIDFDPPRARLKPQEVDFE